MSPLDICLYKYQVSSFYRIAQANNNNRSYLFTSIYYFV